MAKKDVMKNFQTLTDLLIEASHQYSDFQQFALENEDSLKVALYAKSVIDGYAIHTEKLISESEDSIAVFKEFLASLESEEDQ